MTMNPSSYVSKKEPARSLEQKKNEKKRRSVGITTTVERFKFFCIDVVVSTMADVISLVLVLSSCHSLTELYTLSSISRSPAPPLTQIPSPLLNPPIPCITTHLPHPHPHPRKRRRKKLNPTRSYYLYNLQSFAVGFLLTIQKIFKIEDYRYVRQL